MTPILLAIIAAIIILLAYQQKLLSSSKADYARLKDEVDILESQLKSITSTSTGDVEDSGHASAKKDRHAFMDQFRQILDSHISNNELSVEDIAKEMNISRTLLFRNVKHHTGMTPNNFIRIKRLEKASELISSGKYRINEICWMVGFNTPSYFSKCFYEHYGKLPKDFAPETTQGN